MNIIERWRKTLLVLLAVSGWANLVRGEEPKDTNRGIVVAVSEGDLQVFMQKWATYRAFQFPGHVKDEPLLLAALKRDPAGPWGDYLGLKFATVKHDARALSPTERAKMYRDALAYLAPARETLKQAAKAKPSNERIRYLRHEIELDAALASLEAGEDLGGTKERLEALLRAESLNEGNVVYGANSTLGRIALREGNLDEAKRRLALAGHTSGSPQLDSYGPDLVLARELLEKNERASVLAFLDAVERFWANPEGRAEAHAKRNAEDNLAMLEGWRKEIRAGKIPDSPRWK